MGVVGDTPVEAFCSTPAEVPALVDGITVNVEVDAAATPGTLCDDPAVVVILPVGITVNVDGGKEPATETRGDPGSCTPPAVIILVGPVFVAVMPVLAAFIARGLFPARLIIVGVRLINDGAAAVDLATKTD